MLSYEMGVGCGTATVPDGRCGRDLRRLYTDIILQKLISHRNLKQQVMLRSL